VSFTFGVYGFSPNNNTVVTSIDSEQFGDVTTTDGQQAATDAINALLAAPGEWVVMLTQESTITLSTGHTATQTVQVPPAPGNDLTPLFAYIANPTP
jgi:hypothetical protein